MRIYCHYLLALFIGLFPIRLHAEDSVKYVAARLSLLGGKLVVQYNVPPTCRRLDFVNHGINQQAARVIRESWVPLGTCGKISAEGIDIGSTCSTVRFEVPASTVNFDRVYPWAYPLDAGIYAHTSAYAISETCGRVNWTFNSPGGNVVVDGVRTSPPVSLPQESIGYHPVIFFRNDISSDLANLYVDPRFSVGARKFLESTIKQIDDIYRDSFPGLTFSRPFVLAVPGEEGKRWRGDVANGRTMRLTFSANPSNDELKDLQLFFAHEAAHLLQPATPKDAWQTEIDSVREGGAELLSIYVAARLGWISTDEFAQRAEDAVNNCLLFADNRVWKNIRERNWGRAPYDCGLMFHIIASGGGAADISPWIGLREYYRTGKEGELTDFAIALECSGKPDCSPRWLRAIFTGGRSLQDVFDEFSRSSGLFRPNSTLSARQIETLSRKILEKLMAGDCRGQISLYHEEKQARVGAVASCNVLRENMIIVGARDVPEFHHPAFYSELLAQCRTAGTVTLNLKDGKTAALSCRDSVVSLPVLYALERESFVRRFLLGR